MPEGPKIQKRSGSKLSSLLTRAQQHGDPYGTSEALISSGFHYILALEFRRTKRRKSPHIF
jgi:hypothetical protein